MSGNTGDLRRKIAGAGDLASVVRSMKAYAASSIGQYEKAVQSLDDYYRTVELGLSACLRAAGDDSVAAKRPAASAAPAIGAILFGSDQGPVGRFNEVLLDFATETLAALPEGSRKIWAVGERIRVLASDSGLPLAEPFSLPTSVHAITSLVGRLLIDIMASRERGEVGEVYLFHNQPSVETLYVPGAKRLLPLDQAWRIQLRNLPWPGRLMPEVLGSEQATLPALVRGYLFVLLFQACAESLAGENASRLAAMQRAEKNIDGILEALNRRFHSLRQESIDEELFDVISAFEAASAGP